MTETRELTTNERKAVDRLERALAAIPDTLTIYFEAEGSFFVLDRQAWGKGGQIDSGWGQWVQDNALDDRAIRCRYDVGAL